MPLRLRKLALVWLMVADMVLTPFAIHALLPAVKHLLLAKHRIEGLDE